MSDAIAGKGTKFKREPAAGSSAEPFVDVAEIRSISGPEITRETIDVTNLDSVNEYREFIGSFLDGGEVTLEMNFTRNSYDDFLAEIQAGAALNYQIVLPDTGATTLDFAALVTRLGLAIPTDEAITVPVTLKISGPVYLTS